MQRKAIRGYAACALLAVLVAAVGLPLFRSFGPAGLLEDDAYFYAEIGFQLGTRGQSSFDGYTTTDGYHLLWGWMLAAVSRGVALVTLDKTAHLTAMLALYFFVVLATAHRYGRDWFGRFALAAPAFVYAGLMEGPLVALLLVTYVHDVFIRPQTLAASAARWLRPGYLAAGLLPLARIDVTVVLLPLVAWLALRGRRAEAMGTVIALLAGLGLHAAVMLAIDGHLVSVAAQAKASGELGPTVLLARNFGKSAALVAGTLAVLLLVAWRRRQDPRGGVALVVAVTCVAYVAGHLLLNRHVRYWYYLPLIVLAVYLLLELAAPTGWHARVALVAALVVPMVGYKVVAAQRWRAEAEYLREFLGQLPQLVPADGRMFVADMAGTIGFWTNRSSFSGDGLVGPHAYLDRLCAGRLTGFLEEHHICYLVTNFPARGDRVHSQAGLTIRLADVEPLLTPPPGRVRATWLSLYRLVRPGCAR